MWHLLVVYPALFFFCAMPFYLIFILGFFLLGLCLHGMAFTVIGIASALSASALSAPALSAPALSSIFRPLNAVFEKTENEKQPLGLVNKTATKVTLCFLMVLQNSDASWGCMSLARGYVHPLSRIHFQIVTYILENVQAPNCLAPPPPLEPPLLGLQG